MVAVGKGVAFVALAPGVGDEVTDGPGVRVTASVAVGVTPGTNVAVGFTVGVAPGVDVAVGFTVGVAPGVDVALGVDVAVGMLVAGAHASVWLNESMTTPSVLMN